MQVFIIYDLQHFLQVHAEVAYWDAFTFDLIWELHLENTSTVLVILFLELTMIR